MKKTFIYYSILGCFATGAATASPLYINFDGACPDNTLCRVLPNAGQCCAANKTVSKINLPTGSNGWSLSIGTRTIQIFDANGNPIINNLSDTQKMIINNAIAGGATLSGAVIPASEQLVTVTLDMKGGSLPVGFTQTTRTMHPGDLVLSAGVTRSDNAKFVGFYAQGASDSTASPIITVGNATTQTYIAKYTCDNDSRTYMNSKGTCVSDDTVYLNKNGNQIDRDNIDTSEETCISHGTVTLHDYKSSGVPSNFVANMYYYPYSDGSWYSRYSTTYNGQPSMPTYYSPNDISISGTSITPSVLQLGSPNDNKKLYCREHGCWTTSAGAEQPQVMYYLPSVTDCENCENCTDRSFDKLVNGEVVHYYYYQCPCDKSLEGIGNISSCLDISLGCTYFSTGNEENPIVCIPNGAYTTAQTNDLIWGIRQPKALGWRFRGYYLDTNNSDMKWFAESNTNYGAPLNGFGVGNPNNREMVIGTPYATIYTVCVDNTDQTLNALQQNGYSIDLYGAWARDCNPDTGASCSLSINHGDVTYTTSCSGNQSVTNETYGTYNPQCTADTSTVVNLNYSFVNQYGGTVNYTHSFNNTCNYSSNYNFLSTSDFDSYTDGYQLRYLKTNNKYYSPNRSVSCGQNVFGVDTDVNVVGFVCETCNAESGKSRCVSVTNDPSIVYNGSTPGYLWGANASLGYDECKKLECETGYVLQLDSSTGHRYCKSENQVCLENCIAGCNGKPDCANSGNPQDYCSNYCEANAFVCPTNVIFEDGANLRIANVTKTPGQKECTYTIACNGDGAVQNTSITYPWRFNDIPSNGDTSAYEGDTMEITCNGDGNDTNACVTAKLNARLASLSCFTCPNYNGADPSVSPALPQQEGLVCSYNIYCNGRVSFPRKLTKNGATKECNKDTVRCIAHNCTDGYGTYSTLYYLTTEFGKYMCTTGAGGLSSEEEQLCGGGGHYQFFCPESLSGQNGVIVTPDTGNASSTNICKYTLSCSNNYQLSYNNGEGSGLNLITCTGTACSVPNLSTIIDEYSCVNNSK